MDYDDYDFREAAERAEMIQDDLRAEIARLQALVSEAREIMANLLTPPKHNDGAWYYLEVHRNELNAARSFLNRTGE